MWGKSRVDDEETAKAVRNRLITVLGLEHSEAKEDLTVVAAPLRSEAIDAQAEMLAASSPTVLERLSETQDGSHLVLDLPLKTSVENGASSEPSGPATAASVQNGAAKPGEVYSTVDAALTELTQKSDELVDKQTRRFEESLAEIGNKTLSQAEATVRRSVSRLENCVAEAHEAGLTMDESLTSLAQKMTQAAQGQISGLEENLGKIAEQIGSRLQAEFGPLASRVEGYRTQTQEMTATLEGALARFTQGTEETAKRQARLFDEKLAKASEQAVSQVQESVQSGIAQLRETAAQSLEQQIASLGETIEKRLKENMEAWSKAQLEIIQQEASKLSSGLLNQARAESEDIAQSLQARLKSEAQILETKTLEAMHGKMRRITDEFRSIFERALT